MIVKVVLCSLAVGYLTYAAWRYDNRVRSRPTKDHLDMIEQNARTYDVLLMRSMRPLAAAQQLLAGSGKFSHAALVVRGEDMHPAPADPGVYVMESSMGRGSRLAKLEDVIEEFRGDTIDLALISESRRAFLPGPSELSEIIKANDGRGHGGLGGAAAARGARKGE